jgi:hypothetical protein
LITVGLGCAGEPVFSSHGYQLKSILSFFTLLELTA